jgi:hypothetical protein
LPRNWCRSLLGGPGLVEPSYDNATHVGALLSHGLQNLTTIVEIHLPRENLSNTTHTADVLQNFLRLLGIS